jgi:hypothetical protein
MFTRITALVAALTMVTTAGQAVAQSCDRACLSEVMSAYLAAVVKHDPAAAPLAAHVRFTEDGQDQKLGQGLWGDASGVGSFRQDILDPKTGTAGALVVVQEAGQPVLLAVRLKVEGRKITEIETQATHSQAEGAIFNPAGLTTPTAAMTDRPRAAERASREEAVRIAALYPAGLQAGSFVAVDVPFAADAFRNENGDFTAGPPCIRVPSCQNIKTQPLGPGRTAFQQRLIAVDEDEGVVWYRLSWARGPGQRLVCWEAFKIWGGQIHAVQAFMKFAPLNSTSGWD